MCFKHWHFSTIDFQIVSNGQKSNFFEKNVPSLKCSFYTKFLIINTETYYWKIIHIKINHVNYINAEKWCARFHRSQYAIILDGHMFPLNTCLSDGHMTCKIGDWSFSNRFISRNFFNNKVDRLSRKQRFKMKTCPRNITLVLEICRMDIWTF